MLAQPARPGMAVIAILMAWIQGVLSLVCPRCSHARRCLAFVSKVEAVRRILAHLGEPTGPLPVAPVP